MQADLCVIENFVQNLIIILSCRSYKVHDEIKVRQRTKAFLRSSHKIRTSFFLLFASHRRLSIKKQCSAHPSIGKKPFCVRDRAQDARRFAITAAKIL